MASKNRSVIRELAPYRVLVRCKRTGIAMVEDGTAGVGHTCHPNIDRSGSVLGMKARGYWQKKDRIVRAFGFAYNIDRLVVTDEWDEAARAHCLCGGVH